MPISNVEVTIENTQIPGVELTIGDSQIQNVINNVPTGPAIVQVNQGPAGLNFANPMTDAADLIVGSTNGNPARLAKGVSNSVLAMNSGATAQTWTASTSEYIANTIVRRDANGSSDFQKLRIVNAPGDDVYATLNANLIDDSDKDFEFPNESGTIAIRQQPRGQMWFQNNSTEITLSTNYQKIDVASAALDEPIDFDDPVNTRMTYTGATPKVLNVIATVDLYHASGGPMQASVKLRFNDQLIDATQCNATIANQSVGKLHTMWMIEFDTDDYIELWVAATSGTPQVTPVRMRMQVTPLL